MNSNRNNFEHVPISNRGGEQGARLRANTPYHERLQLQLSSLVPKAIGIWAEPEVDRDIGETEVYRSVDRARKLK